MAMRNCMRKMKCATTMGVERQAMNSMSIRSKGFSSESIKTPRCHLRHRNLWHGGDRYRHRHRHRHAFRTLCVSKDRSESEANCNPTDATDRELLIEDLTRRLQVAEQALQESEDRQRALAPYRVSAPKRGIVGNSSYAVRLRSQIIAASRDPLRKPVLIFGEPGLQKDNIAALIHFGSPDAKRPLVSIECDRLTEDGTELFGKGSKRGLFSWLPPKSALLLNNVHKAPESVLPLLEKELITASVAASLDEEEQIFIDDQGHPSAASSCLPRIFMTAETCVSLLDKYATVIRVPPLRVRPEDVDDLTRYFLRSLGRQRGLGRNLELTPEALKRLEAGQYPNNVAELEAAVQRALAQVTRPSPQRSATDVSAEDGKILTLGEEVFWFASQEKDLLRVNLLKTVPMLRRFLRSDTWPERINFGFTVYAFAAIVGILFLGPQDRDHNFALNAFWCYWWPLSFIIYPFLGRIWCAVCPFMIYGELVQRWRLAHGAILKKWPRATMDHWGPWFLFTLFAGILVWEEVWDLPQNAALSSWLLLLITAGAMIGSFFFERRIWCRYLCPIGGMNGLFAKLSVTELRARQGVCSAECSTYSCFKGGPATPPEGLETSGCPVYSHPAQLTDNRNCVLCMDCLKACPHRSIEFRLRVPAADLWGGSHIPIPAESALMFMLLGAVYLHDLPTLIQDTGLESIVPQLKIDPIHIALSLGVLAMPGIMAYGVDSAWRFLAMGLLRWYKPEVSKAYARPAHANAAVATLDRAAASYAVQQSGLPIAAPAKSFLELSYGYLPLVWGGTLAYYLRPFLTEAGRIVPVGVETIGLHGLVNADGWTVVAPPDVVSFLQGVTLLGSTFLSLGMLRRIAGQPWRVIIHHCFLCCVFGAELWHTIMDR